MRLVCPQCDARYEVDEALLPGAGRDVHCSACGAEWFQGRTPQTPPGTDMPPDREPAAAPASFADLPPRTVSGVALDILRQEAEFEARQRAREDGAPAPRLSQRVAQAGPPAARPEPEKRVQEPRDMPGTDTPAATDARPEPGTRHFLRGFMLPFVLIAVASLPYLLAPGMILALPEAEGPITAYVAAIDAMRAALLERVAELAGR